MYKSIAGSTCAAAVLSLAVASAQTYPQTKSTNRPAATTSQRITVTGCVMNGVLTNATPGNETASRSGSPSNEGTSTSNRNGTAGIGVSGSTSTVVGTSGTNASVGGNVDTEAHGAGTLGATDQAGSTVGAGATAGAAPNSGNHASAGAASSYQLSGITNPNEYSGKRVEITGMMVNTRVTPSARRNSTASTASSGNNTMPRLRVTSVRVLGDTCQ